MNRGYIETRLMVLVFNVYPMFQLCLGHLDSDHDYLQMMFCDHLDFQNFLGA